MTEEELRTAFSGLICDSPTCDFTSEPGTYKFSRETIGTPCPKCGENLLTEADFSAAEKMILALKPLAEMGAIKAATPESGKGSVVRVNPRHDSVKVEWTRT